MSDEELHKKIKDGIVRAALQHAKDDLREFEEGMVPKKVITDCKRQLKEAVKGKCTIVDLRLIVYPICLQYKLEEKSFWGYLQGWSKYKKGTK